MFNGPLCDFLQCMVFMARLAARTVSVCTREAQNLELIVDEHDELNIESGRDESFVAKSKVSIGCLGAII